MLALTVRGGQTPSDAYDHLVEMGIPQADAKAAFRVFEERAGRIRRMDDPPVIHRGLRAWYAGPQPGDKCWPALEKYLREDKGWPAATVDSINRSTTKILSHMQPAGMGEIDTRGLVVGHVQSGKTANYTALIAKAADVGYRLFIVLAGVHNTLRQQTQRRLSAELQDLNRTLWVSLTAESEDFRASTTGNTDAFLSDHSRMRILCVAKKNAHVLRRLRKWLDQGSDRILSDCPTLIIDDEADQAGLNAHKNPNERTAINKLLLGIIGTLPKAAYIGYTATPFANVLVNPKGDDLYPKDFIVELPRPPGYFGAERLFGREKLPMDESDVEDVRNAELDMIREVPDEDISLVRPKGTSDRASFEASVPPSLDEAIRYFLLTCAARRARAPRSHESMLIHTTLYVDSHDKLQREVEDAWLVLRSRVASRNKKVISELEDLWERECRRVPAEVFSRKKTSFEELHPFLRSVLDEASVIAEHGSSLDRLVYDDTPRTQIAIGGNTLSRGLTLEGLTVSYFVRSASAYDTLLQMGRWFGYRFGYEDLPRIWMSNELKEAFFQLATVEAEIREDIRKYETQDMTPEQFGVRIRVHPSLAVTNSLKMHHAEECDISYSGTTRQTHIYERVDRDLLSNNIDAADSLIESLGPHNERLGGRYVWTGVPAEKVIDFVRRYRFHPRLVDLTSDALTSYIESEIEYGGLSSWTVVLSGRRHEDQVAGVREIGGLEVNLLNRSRRKPTRSEDTHATVGTVSTQMDFRAGLPDGRKKRGPEDPPLLVLYPISKNSKPSEKQATKAADPRIPLDATEDVLAVAFEFPKSERPIGKKYVRVLLPEPTGEFDEEDEFEDDEADEG
ncbi:MAG: hypothetical protein CMN31_03170 [Sandaracinus sp.]|nr:hypothetical protein [Sandaracinus sp.]MBJ70364.1 hypothetical protein [Sandaracinus sp.]HJL01400.1 Z1 domain-containing protein [Polyangiaceae bacterium LLY-WYZ-15_(1-7)]HJL24207.1 Z1 domain-containing protein [Polyangiaceae bacterium LLY-WYZ-15_(1-7)]